MGFFATLLPREDKFFISLRALSEQAQTGAVLLQQFVQAPDSAARTVTGQKIAQCKAESKRLLGRVTRDVSLSFITPFDREDIQELCAHLYKIPKTIDKIRERLDLHGIDSGKGDFTRQIDLIVQEATAMQDIILALTNKGAAKIILGRVAVLNDLEGHGDAVLGELLVELFEDNGDVRDMLLRKDIYDMLEKVLDRYRDAAGVALQIVLKHN